MAMKLAEQAGSLDVHPMSSSQLMLAMLRLVEAGRDRPEQATGVTKLISVGVLRTLLSALQFRDQRTMSHSRRASLICRGIAERLGWEENGLSIIELAALLHDVGKIGLPDHILMKPGRLSPDEADRIVVQHRVAVTLLQACGVQPEVIDIVAQSHGIKTESALLTGQLHLGARILAAADAYDSLTTRQTYRKAHSHEGAMNILEEQSGKQFDRNVVAALKRWLTSPAAEALMDQGRDELDTSDRPVVSTDVQNETHSLCYLMTALHSIETMYEALVVVDADNRIQVWNFGAEHVFQQSASTMLGQPWEARRLSIVTLSDGDGAAAFRDALYSGQPVCRRLVIKLPQESQQSLRELEIHAIPLGDKDHPQGVMGLVYSTKEARQNAGHFRQLKMAATRDALTGVLNRGELENQLLSIVAECRSTREQTPLSVIFFDLDHFKGINDRLGHSVGDQVLIDVSRLIQDEIYSGELVGRYGGEEFVIVCPEARLEDAIERAERLRRTLMRASIGGRSDLRVTASFGVAELESEDTVDSLVQRADAALYDAKHGGRNRTCSRTAHEKEARKSVPARVVKVANSDWSLQRDLLSNVASDLIVYKLKGFIEDQRAVLVKSSHTQLVLTCGTAGLLGWGSQPDRQPVRITIDIREAPASTRNLGNKQVLLHTVVEPVSRPLRATTFQLRANQILDELRSYCIADFLSTATAE